MNELMLVGRIVTKIKLKELENNKKVAMFNIAVQRNFKNVDGIYETDFIPTVIWDSFIAENIKEYYRMGDMIGIKGRLQTRKVDDTNIIEVVAETVTFLNGVKKEVD